MKLNSIFTSHMVFAVGKPIRIYGEGKGSVEISFASHRKEIVSTSENWFVEFPPMEYGGPYEMRVVLEDETVVLDDIYIGDVYLFSGQSNMQFKLKDSSTPKSAYETNGKLRMYSTDRLQEGEYYTSADGWVMSDKDYVGNWSAITYLVGNGLSKKKQVGVGAIACYQGASVIESWVSKGTLEKANINLPIDQRSADHVFEEFAAWNGDGVLYSHALSQVIPYSINGVVWYQGESDSSEEESNVYAAELVELIKLWRRDFRDDELPFVVIQLANFDQRPDIAWSNIQKAQWEVQSMLPNVKTVICADVCEDDSIHPQTKDGLAQRVVEVLNKI